MDTKLRILAVDDSPQMHKVMRRFLEKHDLVLCSDGSEALALLKSDSAFDVVLSDMDMPIMDGASLYEAIVDYDSLIAEKLVFVTGGGANAKQQRFLRDTDCPVISKPFRSDELDYVIASVVECEG
jgi:CheY-like chemotaxis protein